MGCCFSRGATTGAKHFGENVEVVNDSALSLLLWVNGGGTICKCPPGTTTMVSRPAHLMRGPQMWTATLDLPQIGLQGLQVCSWSQSSLQLKIGLGVHNSVTSHLSSGHGYALNIATLLLLVQKQRRVKMRHREQLARKRRILLVARVRAAKTLQRATRSWLVTVVYECPVCLDDLPLMDTKNMCKSAQGGHRLCAPCATRYVDMAIGEGKLYVRCSGIACAELVSKESLTKLASQGALDTYEANLVGVHTQRLADESDPAFLTFASEHTRRCPACQVLIWRSEGCDQMRCRCGHGFNWSSPEARVHLGA